MSGSKKMCTFTAEGAYGCNGWTFPSDLPFQPPAPPSPVDCPPQRFEGTVNRARFQPLHVTK